jgi:hypothetical protein
LPALVLLRKPLFGLAKRRKQPERYVQFTLDIVKKIIYNKINFGGNMNNKHIIKFRKNQTIVIFFDLEFYVPKNDRTDNFAFQANPYKTSDFIIGGTFLRYYPLNEKKNIEEKNYWIWNYDNEKLMLTEIINLFKESWDIVSKKDDQSELTVCGIGISRIDLSYLFGRCLINNVETK